MGIDTLKEDKKKSEKKCERKKELKGAWTLSECPHVEEIYRKGNAKQGSLATEDEIL